MNKNHQTEKVIFKNKTVENLKEEDTPSPSNFYGGNNNICKVKIRKNFKKIQLQNNKIVSNPFAK